MNMDIKPSNDEAPDSTTRLQALTREYARYSRSAGGLSAIAGGSLCLASYLAGALLPLGFELRLVLVALPLLWLAGKQWLVQHYYQRFGRVEELTTATERRWQRLFVGFTTLVCLIVAAAVLGRATVVGAPALDARGVGYAAVVLALPFVVWRWLRTPLEFVVGVFLFCQAALAFSGRTYAIGLGTAVFPLAALALIAVGIRDHRRFLHLQMQLRSLFASREVRE